MRGRNILIVCILFIIAAISFSSAYTNGFNKKVSVVNPMSQFESIASLQSSVPFKFQVPTLITNEKDISMFNYSGIIVEIQSNNFTFRAAPFVNEGADVSGDYNTYDTDKRYKSNDGLTMARYRADGNKTLINLTVQDMTYSMKFEEVLLEAEAFSKLDIDITSFTETDAETDADRNEGNVEGNDEDTESNDENASSTIEEQQINLDYTKIKNDELNISFMIPKLKSDIKAVYNNNQLAIMMENTLVLNIEYYENGYKVEEFNGYMIRELSTEYLLRYIVDNKFTKGSQEYKDYYTLIENIDTISETFRAND